VGQRRKLILVLTGVTLSPACCMHSHSQWNVSEWCWIGVEHWSLYSVVLLLRHVSRKISWMSYTQHIAVNFFCYLIICFLTCWCVLEAVMFDHAVWCVSFAWMVRSSEILVYHLVSSYPRFGGTSSPHLEGPVRPKNGFLLTSWHSVISRKTYIFISTAVRNASDIYFTSLLFVLE
jgi:hypothetical protein